MGKELSLAREEEEGRPVLLAITSSGERFTITYNGIKRAQEPKPAEGSSKGKAGDTKAKSQSSRKAERANASSSKKDRYRRGYKNRKPDRGDEGENELIGRTAQKLGIVHPGSYCDESETVPHYWIEVDKPCKGILFQCKLCLDYLWLPLDHGDVGKLATLIRYNGKDEGYCRFLNRHRAAKMLMAKLQDLRRLEEKVVDKREFARMTDKILSDKEYDREEVK